MPPEGGDEACQTGGGTRRQQHCSIGAQPCCGSLDRPHASTAPLSTHGCNEYHSCCQHCKQLTHVPQLAVRNREALGLRPNQLQLRLGLGAGGHRLAHGQGGRIGHFEELPLNTYCPAASGSWPQALGAWLQHHIGSCPSHGTLITALALQRRLLLGRRCSLRVAPVLDMAQWSGARTQWPPTNAGNEIRAAAPLLCLYPWFTTQQGHSRTPAIGLMWAAAAQHSFASYSQPMF